MALSDDLASLAARTKEVEERAAAAQNQEKAELERELEAARERASGYIDEVRSQTTAATTEVASRWQQAHSSWLDHLTSIRTGFAERKAEFDSQAAVRRAETAEADARFAIDFALAAVEAAEYAVLDAELARMDAQDVVDGAE